MFGSIEHSPYTKPPNQTSALQLETVSSYNVMKMTPDEQACYVMLDIAATSNLPTSRLPLNLCLVLDRSTSMKGARLQQVKEATRQIIDFLEPVDKFSLVVFSDKAEVLISGSDHLNKAMAKSIASTIQARGGTEMHQGLIAGLRELHIHRTDETVNHMILLTDGQTYGDEDECRQKAEWAGQHQISISTMGLGLEWNELLLDDMANLTSGRSTFIDSPHKVVDVFKATVQELSTVVAKEIVLDIKPMADVVVQEVFQITPHIRRVQISGNKAVLGPLGGTKRKTIILELRVKNLTEAGDRHLLRATVRGDVANQEDRQSWQWTDIRAHVNAGPDFQMTVPQTIINTLGKVAIFKMQEKTTEDLEKGNIAAATQRLEMMATRLLSLGEAELSRAAMVEATRLLRTGMLSEEGKKKIHFGTRALTIIPDMMAPPPPGVAA